MHYTFDMGILSIEYDQKIYDFFADCIDIPTFMTLFNEQDNMHIMALKLDKGFGSEYSYYNIDKVPKIETVGGLMKLFQNIGVQDLFFFRLEFTIEEDYYVFIYENHLRIYFKNHSQLEINNFIIKLLIDISKIDPDTTFDLIKILWLNVNKIIEIDRSGNLLKVYESIDQLKKIRDLRIKEEWECIAVFGIIHPLRVQLSLYSV